MSRVGKKLIPIPSGCKVEISGGASGAGSLVSVTGPRGDVLIQEIKAPVTAEIKDGRIHVNCGGNENESYALHGLYNRLIENMLKGVTEGFTKYLFLNGVGYKAAVKGEGLVLNLGFSHPVEIKPEKGIKMSVLTPQEVQTLGFGKEAATAILKISGVSREKVGAVASNIRAMRPVEPYHLYGIRYSDEQVIKKESKSGAKKK